MDPLKSIWDAYANRAFYVIGVPGEADYDATRHVFMMGVHAALSELAATAVHSSTPRRMNETFLRLLKDTDDYMKEWQAREDKECQDKQENG